MDKDTVAMHFVVAALGALSATAKRRVLAAAGIRAELLSSSDARVTAESFSALWLACARELDDEFFGLDTRRMKVGSFALLCQALVPMESLDRAVRRMLRGFAVFLEDIDGALRVDGQDAIIVVSNRVAKAPARRFADETFCVLLHGLMCWLVGKRIALRQVDFAFAKPPYAQEYQVMFCDRLRFDADRTALHFDARLLRAPIVQTAASLREFLRTAPQSVFLKYKNRESWSAKVRRRLREDAGDVEWPGLGQIASGLHLTTTTLRRRLDSEGTSYRKIKDELRRDMAIHQLGRGQHTIAQVGNLLGYREASAFHRAFKKWCGVQPGEYRNQQARIATERAL